MSRGIRAEVMIQETAACPVAGAAREVDASAFAISKSLDPSGNGTLTEEFMLDIGSRTAPPDVEVELDEVFSYGSKSAYRYTRDHGWGCPCECVEEHGCPVVDVHTRGGTLYLVFHAADMTQLQTVIESLRARYPDVDIQRLLRSEHDHPEGDLVFVDRGNLTARQREVLETAHRMGYFDHPRESNAGEVAQSLDITASTFTEHLGAAQTKILDAVLDT